MKTRTLFQWMSVALLASALVACNSSDKTTATAAAPAAAPTTANQSPATAVTTLAQLMKRGDIDGVLKLSLPLADYQQVRKAWATSEFKTKPIDAKDRADFAKQMQQLTAPDAEKTLFTKLQPQLAQYNTKYKAMLPMYIGMGQTMAATAINKSKTMTPQAQEQAKDVVMALGQWAQTTNWGDAAKAKQAIAIVCDAARKLGIKTLDQARALTYDQAMAKYSTVWGAVKQVVALYGLDLNKILSSVNARTVSSKDGKATVAYTYSILGKPLTGQVNLVQSDGHWYNPKVVKAIEKDLAENASNAAKPTTTAQTKPAPSVAH